LTVELAELEPLPGRRLAVDRELTIGRQGCDVTISDPQVSRRHARLAPGAGGAEVSDLGSRNGTFVNDDRIADARALAPGDRLRIGATTWEVEVVSSAAAESVQPRGDVPAPPSGAHEVPAAMRAETPAGPQVSAARRVEATLISYAVVVLTAIGVVLYLIVR
jgi:pSer/pThr/pTyr-binding forkhead associated (FHA) protein